MLKNGLKILTELACWLHLHYISVQIETEDIFRNLCFYDLSPSHVNQSDPII